MFNAISRQDYEWSVRRQTFPEQSPRELADPHPRFSVSNYLPGVIFSALHEEGTLRRFLHGPDGTPLQRDAVVFALLREELAGSPVARAALRAFDAAGDRIL